MIQLLQSNAASIPLKDTSIHMCATSPPYWGLRSYEGVSPTYWPSITFTPMAGLPPITISEQVVCLGLENDPWAYVGHMVAVFREVRRVLRDDGTAWLNLGDSYAGSQKGIGSNGKVYGGKKQRTNAGSVGLPVQDWGELKAKDLVGIPWRVAFALQADGWWLRNAIVWAKGISFCDSYSGSVMPESVTDRFTRSHEQVFLLAKNKRYFFDQEAAKEPSVYPDDNGRSRAKVEHKRMPTDIMAGMRPGSATYPKRNPRDVWAINPRPYRGAHFATWPESLVTPMILAGTSEKGCCSTCGAVVERGKIVSVGGSSNPDRDKMILTEDGPMKRTSIDGNNASQYANQFVQREHITTGWSHTCAHSTSPIPCTVLDPFSGSGTTGMVAIKHNRSFIGLDLSGTYIHDIAKERTSDVQRKLF